MRIAFLTHGTPHPSQGGSGHWVTTYARFLARSHDVAIIRIRGRFPAVEQQEGRDTETEQEWRSWGARFVDLEWPDPANPAVSRPPSLIQHILKSADFRMRRIPLLGLLRRPSGLEDCDRFPQLGSLLQAEKIDVLVAPGPLCTAYASTLGGICKVSVSSEGPHINREIRHQTRLYEERPRGLKRWTANLENRILCRREEEAGLAILQGYTKVLFSGQHYLRWAKEMGLGNCTHIPKPLDCDDSLPPKPIELKRADNFRILMMGHLSQTSNRTQLPILMDQILPAVGRLFEGLPWAIRLVGRHDSLGARYAALLNHPRLDFAGPIHPSDPEFLQADVLLAPVTAKTGPRIKILQAFARGLPVVAHVNNQLGIAELVHYGNCILGETGLELAAGLRRIHDSPELARRLATQARETYRASYDSEYACHVFEELLEDTRRCFKHGQTR